MKTSVIILAILAMLVWLFIGHLTISFKPFSILLLYWSHALVIPLYDKHGIHTRSTIEKGLSQYEYLNKYRFKEVIVISNGGNIHRHKHNS